MSEKKDLREKRKSLGKTGELIFKGDRKCLKRINLEKKGIQGTFGRSIHTMSQYHTGRSVTREEDRKSWRGSQKKGFR